MEVGTNGGPNYPLFEADNTVQRAKEILGNTAGHFGQDGSAPSDVNRAGLKETKGAACKEIVGSYLGVGRSVDKSVAIGDTRRTLTAVQAVGMGNSGG